MRGGGEVTIIKQTTVSSSKHARNLRDYIDGKEAVLRGCLNVVREGRWFNEMAETRARAGHDRPSRKGARSALVVHQVLAFLPEEADMNGGPMTPGRCEAYAREYASLRYGDHQVAYALHRERCEADGTERYAVHLAINVTDLSTGRRLHEGRSAQAKRDRARTVRELDAKWGLHQVEKDVPNSKIHRQQPQRQGIEKRIIDRAKARGIDPEDASYKYNLRELCRLFRNSATSLGEYRAMLAEWGVETEVRDGKVYVIDTDNRKHAFSLARLDRSLTANALETAFERNDSEARMAVLEKEVREKQRQIERYAGIRRDYLDAVAERYRDYRELVRDGKGARLADIPQFKIPRPPAALAKDMGVKRAALSYAFKADELRAKLASDAPKTPARKRATGSGAPSACRPARPEPQRQARRDRGER